MSNTPSTLKDILDQLNEIFQAEVESGNPEAIRCSQLSEAEAYQNLYNLIENLSH